MDYRNFFEMSDEMLATADLKGRFGIVNDAFERVLGYEDHQLVGELLLSFVHPADQDITADFLADLGSGVGVRGFENRLMCRDGSHRWLRWSANASAAEDRMWAVAVDVTDLRVKDAALARVVADLQRSNEELSQFAYVASHDLSEPLRVVAGHVELLAHRYEGRLDDDADRYIAFAVDGCARMRSLIDDLLAFSRAGRETEAVEQVDLGAVAEAVVRGLAELVDESGATVVIGTLPTVTGSRSQMAQVLTNLVANALKFRRTDAHPTVHIDGHRDGAGWRIEVVDNGIGIEPAYRERIFRIFQRLHSQEAYPGTGIGLAICRKMVELRGGRIWCVSADPQGARFCFTVPDVSELAGVVE